MIWVKSRADKKFESYVFSIFIQRNERKEHEEHEIQLIENRIRRVEMKENLLK